ncbi:MULTISPECIES: potassium-transporting ATPase subunit F [Psychrobacillus]|uniref:Potassium-transporting ATPase subunit F n=1 Tax=Psychrobacillus faecigallinarum TaxID=2762235 RepID=A0ABR8R6V0_9BACI|nr:potassium-transporting ATPase subunit F [Psychrobacillus faecigallinarum]QEY23077.1 potassium-transporting ATPase subunit F [Psychrobacillus sp. AK 1817]QGM32523.1 potassium-transporting ATPase subunit F [Bacillus sp. N3536]
MIILLVFSIATSIYLLDALIRPERY